MLELDGLSKGQVLLYVEENLSEEGVFTVSTPDPASQIAILQEEELDGEE